MYIMLNVAGPLKFVLDPQDYDQGTHSVVITATNLQGETKVYEFSFGKNKSHPQPSYIPLVRKQ